MAVTSSGAISFSSLASEFGGSTPHSLSEYYRNAEVPSSVSRDADAASLSGSVYDGRGAPYSTNPVINSGGVLYTHSCWADNGFTGTGDVSFTVNLSGTYSYYFGYYVQNATRTANHKLFVDGSLVEDCDLTAGNNTSSKSGTFSASSGSTIRITCSWPSVGWGNSSVTIGGSSTNNDDINVTVNSGVPTSGSVSLADFYGTTNT